MTEILIILACVPLYVVNAFCDKYASMQSGGAGNLKYNAIKFSIGSLILLPIFLLDSLPKFMLGALLCGALCGVMYAISKGAILWGYEKTSVSFMTLCHASGMILPCIVGHFLWDERLGIISFIGILLTIASIILLKDSKASGKKLTLSGIIIGLAVFLGSGGVMVLQKLMGRYFVGESISAYNFYSFVVGAIIMAALSVFKKPQAKEAAKADKGYFKKLMLSAFGSAFSLCVISLVMTGLAGSVPSAVLFPLFNGSGIILVCLGSVAVFREKMSIKQIIGLFVGVAGLCIVNL